MHRLRKGKKKEDEEGVPPVPQPTPTTSHNPFKWGRTPEPPPKPQLDLEHALPASDDFRTSLLMPNLAQRFSILQQEMAAAAAAAAANGGVNPNAPIGTASDGMDGFVFTNPPQFTPMGEITETSSIAEATSAQQNRLTTKSEESVGSDESGGIMNRSRGGEGNVLFGGRQKVYRVPNAYTSGKDSMDDSNPGSSMGGRSVGSHDVPEGFGMPKHRREQHESEEANGGDDYNKNRNTSSSTGSAPTTITRSSTAATSVSSNRSPSGTTQASASASPPPVAPVATKPRKALYEQALDQQLQDQQTTAVGRLERLASLRKAAVSPPPANSYQGSFSPPGLFQQSNTSPSSPTSPKQTPQWSVNVKRSPDSPMSTPEEDEDEQDNEETVKQGQKLGQSLSPHMAQFNFGLEPRSQSPISPPVSASAIQFPTQGPFSPGILSRDQPQRNPSSDKLNLQIRAPSPMSDSNDQYGQKGSKTFLSMRSSASDSSYDDQEESDRADGKTSPISRNSLDNIAPLHPRKNFGAHPTDSEYVEVEPPSPVSPVSPISPIFSTRISDDFMRPSQPLRNPAISPTSPKFSADVQPSSEDDSPTLPPGQGLSMLVRQHLRTDSGHSSVYAGSTYTRMSRVSNYGPGAAAAKNSKEPDAPRPSATSGSSGGDLWEFDDWDGGYFGEDDGPRMRGSSPSTISDNPPTPAVPQKDSARTRSDERRDDEDLARERERSRGRADSRTSERDRAMSRASERDRDSPAGEDDNDKDWEQQLAFRRQIIQQNLRNHEKVNSQHELDFPPDMKAQQGKNGGSGGGFGVLRSKGSNGIISKNDPSRSGRDSPGPGMRKEGSRSRMNSSETERRTEEERRLRETVRGPKNIPPGGYPTQQHPPHSHHHIPPPNPARLNTNLQNENRPKPRSPVGLPHPLHSPIITPRPRQRSTRDQRNDAHSNGEQNTRRGQPMGWRDDGEGYAQPRSAPGTQPGSPVSQRDGHHGIRKQPSMPRMGGPDMHRPGQGQNRDQEPRRHGGPPPGPGMNNGHMNHGPMGNGLQKKQSFDRDGQPHGSEFRRPRGNSNASSGPTMRQRRGTFDNTPLPPLNTSALSPPTQHLQASSTPNSAITMDHSPAFSQATQTPSSSANTTPASAISSKSPPAALIQSIANSNAGFAPAKKRVVDKSKIGDPKLISSTSNIPTVDLPTQTSPALGSAKEKDGRKRRMTETRSIFSGFGRNKSSEEVPALPTGSPMMPRHHTDDEVERSSFTDDPPPKAKKTGGKLRKSTSDGGALSARARKEALARSPTVPKLPKGMEASGGAPAGMI
ncbi:uncharacterized protein H6S33_000254 [Morchella sextelata]|uniref:uncharacterized protein n=1 Tax=Morchella sextelata TaxID=1174677 RepID=UPI001D04C20A|nr:uncharacterized protein H6S33_000254 [Morchella sextelata]KAH0614618.1 hypothetical protein H6S33_000254 [Morchella sextelata]